MRTDRIVLRPAAGGSCDSATVTAAGAPATEVSALTATCGEKVIAWYAKAAPGQPTILYFHGNGGNAQDRANALSALVNESTFEAIEKAVLSKFPIPDWFAAIDHAFELLKPGGTIGVVDFYVSRKYPAEGHIRHSQATQFFWPTMFRNDNVYPSPDHVPYLHRKFVPQKFVEARARVPDRRRRVPQEATGEEITTLRYEKSPSLGSFRIYAEGSAAGAGCGAVDI